jgi:hypothetical protein
VSYELPGLIFVVDIFDPGRHNLLSFVSQSMLCVVLSVVMRGRPQQFDNVRNRQA